MVLDADELDAASFFLYTAKKEFAHRNDGHVCAPA